MNEIAKETKQLVRLQAVELELTRLSAALRVLPAEVAAAEAQLKAAQKCVSDADAGLKREELLRASHELEIAGHKAKAARFRAQMDTAKNATQASALEHEINFAETEVGRLEDLELSSMEKTEAIESQRAQAIDLGTRLTETVGLIRARVGEQDLEFREQLTALKLERQTLRTQIVEFDEGARLAHFDRIAGSRGTGLARAANQQCSGCRMGIRPQVWNQLRDGLVAPCESCSRILYYDPAMEPPPAKTAKGVLLDTPSGTLPGSSIKRKQAGI